MRPKPGRNGIDEGITTAKAHAAESREKPASNVAMHHFDIIHYIKLNHINTGKVGRSGGNSCAGNAAARIEYEEGSVEKSRERRWGIRIIDNK
jgi:hypothetical protein